MKIPVNHLTPVRLRVGVATFGIAFIVLIALLSSCRKESGPDAPVRPKQEFSIGHEYSIIIMNEHRVQCISAIDTVTLYFENAYRLSGETIVFIKK